MIIFKRKKAKNTVDSGAGVGMRSYGRKNIFYTRGGVQVRERKVGSRILYSAESPDRWIHPWYTSVGYFTAEAGKLKNAKGDAIAGFGAVVKPGFVNGVDPVVLSVPKIVVGQQQVESSLLSGARTQDVLDGPGLLDGPLIPLYGFAVMSKGIPAGLVDLGAVPLGGGTVSGSGDNMTLTISGESSANPRYVASTGIYLQCARPTAQMDVSTFNYPLDSIEYNVSYAADALDRLGVRARLAVGIPEPNQKPTLLDKLSGGYSDPGIDCWMVATVYLLSPENPEMDENGPKITEAWVPYVKHHTYWNLEYRWKLVPPVNKPVKSDMSTLVITGRYTLAGQGMLSAQNSGLNNLLGALFNANNTQGRFWTI
jgi:hypothetical protein